MARSHSSTRSWRPITRQRRAALNCAARGPRLRLLLLEDRLAPSTVPAGLDYDPARIGPQPIHLPQLTPLPRGTPDPGLGFTGDRYPAGPAFDATGHALVNNKSRINNDLLRLYNAWRQYGPDWAAHP